MLPVRPLASASAPILRPLLGQQIRGKKKLTKALTIPVVLLQDVPYLGRKGSVVAVPRGRMRNVLYPQKAADYYTSRAPPPLVPIDPTFVVTHSTKRGSAGADSTAAPARAEAPAKTFSTPPSVIHDILNAKLPGVLEFDRRLMVEGEPEIFGSVSEKDVVDKIREYLQDEEQAKLVGSVKEEWVKMDKMKMVGVQDIVVQVKGALDGEGVKRTVRVVGHMG
ncbi:hypothetical protein EX30DRAFT_338442 [Ascodesmis nigricans]|uniref:Ribosomal protein L9 domain-containing protein n=1 Tax=Ascodesmis nigricans TaxID=341454 RepID=A0A4S2N3M5_9PEZI|nr:hypothetical protein EX30DRAFT_338442 [Ascodesmis nigricans]